MTTDNRTNEPTPEQDECALPSHAGCMRVTVDGWTWVDHLPTGRDSAEAVPDAATDLPEMRKMVVEAKQNPDGVEWQTFWDRMTEDQIIELMDAASVARTERDAALAAIERVRAVHEKSLFDGGKCLECELPWPCNTVAALDGAPEPEGLSIPIPNVPFGPEGVAPTIATANYLIEVVKKLDSGYANVGGSNVTATLRKLLVDAAEALRELPVEGESK